MPFPDAKYPFDQRLVAAAPALLDALRGVLPWAACECGELEDIGDDLPCDYCVACAAIDRATGKESE